MNQTKNTLVKSHNVNTKYPTFYKIEKLQHHIRFKLVVMYKKQTLLSVKFTITMKGERTG